LDEEKIMTASLETFEFQAEAHQMLQLVIVMSQDMGDGSASGLW
jgi:hypothetical protein